MTDQTIHLADYTPPTCLIDTVDLTFALDPTATRVKSKIAFRPNPDAARGDLWLDGHGLKLISATIDGAEIEGLQVSDTGAMIPQSAIPDRVFLWEAAVEINPTANTSLDGLYVSNGMYCTQCEAEGFRKITYYPDRPDVMATFSVRIESDALVMLSNGNPTGNGDGWATWHDPWPKPAYLFALVAGDLVSVDDAFTTMSGREVDLKIFVRPGDEDKCAYAMDSLIRSMKWDEEVYGREYDLDLFMIVAVDDFNMGAMENKGLNIFNSSLVLASPETATDGNYERIESVIAHEYFHNWTGNRITCRDWFQLSLKEGLTVFRDQKFSGDQRSHAVQRIGDVAALRSRQFREDAGPLAHSVRPESYIEINNFYTATIYEKGAEVIGMLHTLVGAEAYRKALDLYFERHDGQACTIEDWLQVFEDSTGRDLGQFKLWYRQAGTPKVEVSDEFDDGTYTLTLRQSNADSPGQTGKKPQLIPVAVGLLNPNGDEVVETTVLELDKAEQSFVFEGLAARPIPSILRGFSAPVVLEHDISQEQRAFLLAHDTDPFNKWEAGRNLATATLHDMALNDAAPDAAFLDAMHRVAKDETLDPAFRAFALALPGQDELAQSIFAQGNTPDPIAIYHARRALNAALAAHMGEDVARLYGEMEISGRYSPAANDAGKRALRGMVLALLSHQDDGAAATALAKSADNMTETMAALSCLLSAGKGEAEVAAFYEKWQHDRLVIDKWFTMQVSLASPETAVVKANALAAHRDFDWRNPNRFRSLIGGATIGNPAGFHNPDGSGYAFFADWLIKLDPINPQTAARMSTAFDTWKRYDAARQELIKAQLDRIAATEGLSKNVGEMIGRIRD